MERVERLRRLARKRRLRQARKLLAIAVLAAALVQVYRGGSAVVQQPAAPRPPVETTADVQWLSVLRDLDGCRQELFRSQVRDLLSKCDVPGSAAWRADSRALDRLISQQVRIAAVPLELISAEVQARRWSEQNEYVQLLVRDRLAENEVSIADAQLKIAARDVAEWSVTLRRGKSAAEWRYFEIKRRPMPSASP